MLEWVKQHWHIDLTAEVPVPWWWLILMTLIGVAYSISLLRRGRNTPAPVSESDQIDKAGHRLLTIMAVSFLACTAAVMYTSIQMFGLPVTVFAAGLSGMVFTFVLIFSYGKSVVDAAGHEDGVNAARERLLNIGKEGREGRWEDLPTVR